MLTQMIATGGMAEIYLGFRDMAQGLSKRLVVKRLRPELVADRNVVAMFEDEARVTTLLSHPYVITAFDVGEADSVPYLVLEYIPGHELNRVARRGVELGAFMSRYVAVEIARQVALALGYCHTVRDDVGSPLGLIHRDISPNNILITEEGFAKVIDFGVAQFSGQSGHSHRAVPGKLGYMSPEQVAREKLDPTTDLFSLGVILYELTVGRRLFRGQADLVRDRIARVDIQPPTFVDHDYPGALEAIVMKCLERYPEDRYQSGYQLAGDLADFLSSQGARVGAVDVARHLDELASAGGAEYRSELWPAAEEADDLDFDSRSHGAPSGAREIAGWDDHENDAEEVAAALGVDVALVRRRSRAPTSDYGLLSVADEES